MFQDLKLGARILLKSPSFTAVALLSLALGIGANTAIFSLVDAVLLKKLPVQNPENLVIINSFNDRAEQQNFSYPIFEQLSRETTVFSGVLAATDGTSVVDLVTPTGAQSQAELQLVSDNYFQVLGVNAVIGRTFAGTVEQTGNPLPLVVLSYGMWQRQFGGDEAIVGKNIRLKQHSFMVAGVTSPTFFGEAIGRSPDIWAPLSAEPLMQPGYSSLVHANVSWLRIMARLKSGESLQSAESAVSLLLSQIRSRSDEVGQSAGYIAKVKVLPGGHGLNEFQERFGKPLKVLMAIALLVLLIACANIANLLLARATSRQREVAVRMAIGASRLRLIRQLLTESVLLAVFGAVLGLILATWFTRILLLLASESKTPVPIDVHLSLRVLGFTFIVSIVTALLFGLAPAFFVTRQNLHSSLKLTTASPRRQLLSRPLVVAQIALSLLLLTGAGLFLQTLKNLRSIDLGFRPEQLLQVRLDTQSSGYASEQLPDLYRRLSERLHAAPGIRSASLSMTGFRSGSSRTCCISVEGYSHQPNEDRQIEILSVSPDYFGTLGIPILSGRDFNSMEVGGKGEVFAKVAIVNQAFARQYFLNASPLGHRFGWGTPPESATYDIQIIGVVKDTNYGNLRDRPKPLIYFPSNIGSLITVSANSSSGTAIQTLRQEIKAVDASLEISSVSTISELVDQALVQERLLAKLSTGFSVIAVLLACIGLYGLMSHNVAVRTREIGIRIALGAQQLRVLRMVFTETMKVVVAGLVLGLIGAFVSTRLITSLLFGLRPNDPATLIASTVLLFIVAGVSGWVPARCATKVDPIVALREE